MSLSVSEFPVKIETKLNFIERPGEGTLNLLLHGYRQKPQDMVEGLESYLPKDQGLISLAGPYLVPNWTGEEFTKGYAWYFFDHITSEMVVPMDAAVKVVKELLESKLENYDRLNIIGYSQGGYIAPFIGEVLPKTKTVTLIAARLRTESMKEPFSFEIHQIHGTRDEIVDYKRSLECFEEWKKKGQKGEFLTVEGLGHKLKSSLAEKLLGIL